MLNSWYSFFTFLHRIRYPYKKHSVLLALVVLLSLFPFLEALILEHLVDDAITGNVKLLLVLITAMLAMIVAESVAYAGYGWLSGTMAPKLTFEIQRRLYAHIQSLNFSFFVNTPSGEVVSRLLNDVESLETFTTRTEL